jgi:hypothetical protein
MKNRWLTEIGFTVLGSFLLLVASEGRHPYGFYMLLRLAITVGAAYWAWRVYEIGLWGLTWVFAAVALFLNPFLPVRMPRSQWQPIDFWLGILLLAWCGFWFVRNRRSREG